MPDVPIAVDDDGSTIQEVDDRARLGQRLGISATGQIVGVFADAESISHGFLLSGGTFAMVDVPVAMGRNTAVTAST
jgi:probable HAF family extracellular repeat protein